MLTKHPCISGICHGIQMYDHRSETSLYQWYLSWNTNVWSQEWNILVSVVSVLEYKCTITGVKHPCISGICHGIQTYDHRSPHQVHWKTEKKGRKDYLFLMQHGTQSKIACYWHMQKPKHSEGWPNFSIHLWRKYVRIYYQTSFHGPVWKPSHAQGCGTLRASRTYQWCQEMVILDNYPAHPYIETSCQR